MISIVAGRAKQELKRIDNWWRANRDYEDLFIDEFEETVKVLEDVPNIGRLYCTSKGKEVLYVLMRKTRYHVFYVVEDEVLKIVSVWGAERARGPKL